jgi:hypothetical protein
MNLHTSLRIFPDTSHHFHFVAFKPEHLQASPDLSAFCQKNNSPWLHVTASGGIRVPWVRARFTSRFNNASAADEPGLLLAIESNLGRVQRGWVLQPKERLAPDQALAHTSPKATWTPYAHAELTDVPSHPEILSFAVREDTQLNPPVDVDLELELTWLVPVAHPVDVDLIVDFGNTRTVAVAIEHNQAAHGLLGQICRPIRFSARSDELPFRFSDSPSSHPDTSGNMIDSWFVLHEPLFSNLEPHQENPHSPLLHWVEEVEWESAKQGFWIFAKSVASPAFRTLRIPQICVQLSPALLGPEADQILTQLPVQAGGNFLLSSPKRYLWDQDPVGYLGQTGQAFWTMYLNRWNPAFSKASDPNKPEMLPKLTGTVLRFLNQDGCDWMLDQGPPPNERPTAAARPVPNPDQPAFPRSDALTWAALTVIETAYRNIMSAEWRLALGQPFVKRRLRSITVTFPPGWTGQELAAYRRKWQKAIDIFSLAHLHRPQLISSGGDRPLLLMDIDEAVASQLPLVYSEIRRLGNEGENWIELVGRGRGTEARARIMNIDIGGGTTDIAIIEYNDEFPGPGVQLVSNLLYRDSSTIAGDALVRRAIEAVLLPALASGISRRDLEAFNSLLCSVKRKVGAWRRINRQIFIPIIYRWLQDLATGRYQQPETGLAPTPQDILGSIVIAQNGPLADFTDFRRSAGLPDTVLNPSSPLNYDRQKLSACITETFSDLFHSLAKAADAFDCDLVFISGKPSELPPLRPLLEESLPLLPHRIVFAKDTQVGSWYPLSNDGRINDAKTATVAGAALNQAVRSGLIPHWKITRRVSPHLPKRNYWGLMPQAGRSDFGSVYLEPKDDGKVCPIMVGSRIGRRLLPSKTRPEPVYLLRWRDSARYRRVDAEVTAMLQVTLRRVVPEEPKPSADATESRMPAAEHLTIDAVQGVYDGKPVLPADLELCLCTIDSDEYWMDACIFHAEWPENPQQPT